MVLTSVMRVAAWPNTTVFALLHHTDLHRQRRRRLLDASAHHRPGRGRRVRARPDSGGQLWGSGWLRVLRLAPCQRESEREGSHGARRTVPDDRMGAGNGKTEVTSSATRLCSGGRVARRDAMGAMRWARAQRPMGNGLHPDLQASAGSSRVPCGRAGLRRSSH